MNLLICAFGARFEDIPRSVAAEADLIYLTDTLRQKGPAMAAKISAALVDDDDFCPSNEEMESLVRKAKDWARNWHRQGALGSLGFQRGVHCPALITQSLTIDILALFKPAHLYLRLLRQHPVTRIRVAGEGPWKEAAFFAARLRDIPIEVLSPGVAAAPDKKKTVAVKGVLTRMNRFFKKPAKGSVLYSSAPRFAMPFLEKAGGCYLRDTFSFRMFRQSLGRGFSQVLPDYFTDHGSAAQRTAIAARCFQAAETHFSAGAFFEWEGENFWPLFREPLRRLLDSQMTAAMGLLERFHEMFRTLAPRAVVVDEEVCVFNKTLVRSANALGIPTFALVHGEPYDDIGSIPSSASRVLAWGPCTARRLEEWGIAPEKIEAVGAPQFSLSTDPVRTRKAVCSRFAIPKEAPLALFGAFPFSPNESATFLRPSYGVQLQEKSLGAALRGLERHPRLHLIVKFHPYQHERCADFSKSLVDAAPASVRSRVRFVFDAPAAELIAAADTVWTVLSTMYAETLPWKKPVFAFRDAAYPHPASRPQWGADINDPAACAEAIDASLSPSRLAETRSRIEEEIADYFVDGNRHAAERALAAIEKVPARDAALPAAGPLVSVVMGVYNGEAYLAEQIESILGQTHANLELVVFDDGSRDRSVAIAESFAARDRRVRVVRNAGNKGLVANFLEGLGAAGGEFVAFSDQDDVWKPRKIETLLGVLGRDAKSVLAFSDMEVCDEQLKPISRSFWKTAGIRPKGGRLAERAVLRNLAPGCSMLFRREVKEAVWELVRREDFKSLNGADILDNTPFMHDHLVFVAAAALGPIVHTPETLAKYRQHRANEIGAFYEPSAQKKSASEILGRQIALLEKAKWAERGLDLKRLKRYHAARAKDSVFARLAALPDHLYLRA